MEDSSLFVYVSPLVCVLGLFHENGFVGCM